MPIYVYKALTSEGRELVREAAAPNEEELKLELERQGLLLKGVRQKRMTFFSLSGQRVKPEDFLQCNQELITLLKAGLTIPEALDLSSDRPDSPVLTTTLKRILQEVKTGNPLSEVCAKYPLIFDGLYLSTLKTGEKTGDLASPLLRYQEYLKQKISLQSKVSQAMVYPFFLLMVLVGVMTLLFTFVMPRFAALYSDFNATLPLPTRILMGVIHHLPVVSVLAAGVALAAWIGFKAWTAGEKGRYWMDEAKQHMPLVDRFTQPFMVSQLTRTLSTLLSGGAPLTEALRVSRDALSNVAYAARLDRVIQRVLEGEGFSQSMGAENMVPRSAVKLIEVGEASGQLEAMLEEIAHSSERILENRVQRLMVLIEPVFILLTGLLIGTVIVVMYLPIIHLTDIVK